MSCVISAVVVPRDSTKIPGMNECETKKEEWNCATEITDDENGSE